MDIDIYIFQYKDLYLGILRYYHKEHRSEFKYWISSEDIPQLEGTDMIKIVRILESIRNNTYDKDFNVEEYVKEWIGDYHFVKVLYA